MMLYKIKMLLNDPNLRLRLILLDIEEYRYLNGWNNDRKRGSSRYERIPTALVEEMILDTADDYCKLIPPIYRNSSPQKITEKLPVSAWVEHRPR